LTYQLTWQGISIYHLEHSFKKGWKGGMVEIPKKGRTKEEILELLSDYKKQDINWKSGRAFGYIYDPGEEIIKFAEEVYNLFLSENALDFTAYPSLMKIENDLIAMIRKHLPSGVLLKAFKLIINKQGAALLDNPDILFELAGIKEGQMPKRTAPLNEVLDAMPPEWREKLLLNVANSFFILNPK
jgi:hypothetical protein